jgi:hypothetical protein
MKIRIYISINQYATDGYSYSIVPSSNDYLKDSDNYRFIKEIEFNLNEHLSWLCEQAAATGIEMAKEATDAYNRATAKRLEFESKFLQLEHITDIEGS